MMQETRNVRAANRGGTTPHRGAAAGGKRPNAHAAVQIATQIESYQFRLENHVQVPFGEVLVLVD